MMADDVYSFCSVRSCVFLYLKKLYLDDQIFKMRSSLLFTCVLCVLSLLVSAQQHPVQKYNYNRAPLAAGSYIQLPLGSIKARGWLLKQLELQRDGATGHAEELYNEAENLGPDSDWLGGNGSGWERVPYYVKGLVALAYTLDDTALKVKAAKWIKYTLDHQRPNGLFGPEKMNDWWPRMPMMYAMQSYYEATGDEKVISFFTKYFKYEREHLDQMPLYEWSKSRTGDNIELVLWLYNKTGDPLLITLAEKLKSQAYPWAEIFTNNQFYHFGDDFHTKHSVSVGQALKFPALYAQLMQTTFYKDALEKGINHLIADHGQASGIASGTEFLAGKSSFQGTETCTVVEWMQSLETAARIIHDVSIGDRLEKIAFNTLPAQFSRDIKEHLYYSQPNQVVNKYGHSGFDEDYDGGILLSPYSGMGCCRYNMHMGWPYFVKNSWVSTPDKGLAVIAYAPVEVNALVADDVPINLEVATDYPFKEQILIKVTLGKSVRFPLLLRMPEWCRQPKVMVNGQSLKGMKTGSFFKIDRVWQTNDQVTLEFPMEVKLSDQVNNSVSVERGPLVYSLKINANYSIRKQHPVPGFYDYEVTAASPWNYALVLDRKNGGKTIRVEESSMPENPFIQSTTPVKLHAQAKRVQSWTIADNQMHAFEVPASPLQSEEALEEITLIPFGAENIRITNFPVVGPTSKSLKHFHENFSQGTLGDWIVYGGGWFIKDGAINAASNKGSWGSGIHGSKAIKTGTDFKDFTYEAEIKISSKGNAGLLFRVTEPALGADAYKGYYVGLDADASKIELGKSSGQKWTALQSVKQKIDIGSACHIKIEAIGSQIKVYLNHQDMPVLSCNDNTYQQGAIGVRSYDCLTVIDNLNLKTF